MGFDIKIIHQRIETTCLQASHCHHLSLLSLLSLFQCWLCVINVTCYTKSLLSCIHVNTSTYLLIITCTLLPHDIREVRVYYPTQPQPLSPCNHIPPSPSPCSCVPIIWRYVHTHKPSHESPSYPHGRHLPPCFPTILTFCAPMVPSSFHFYYVCFFGLLPPPQQSLALDF